MTDSTNYKNTAFPIDYGEEFVRRVVDLHAGSENLPDFDKWITDHAGGRVVAFRERLLPQIKAFSTLENIDILDFGCGTGSSTVTLAEAAGNNRITAVDIDGASLDIAHLRFDYHSIASRIRTGQIPPVKKVGDLDFDPDSFDFILLNGVLEHVVPFRTRDEVLLEAWRMLRPGGLLFVSETPNPLWPIDRHTTGLPFISWMPSGMAHWYAVTCKRHNPGSDLDARGRRGSTFWEIVRPLKKSGYSVEVMNVTQTKNRLLPAGETSIADPSLKRRIGTAVCEGFLGNLLSRMGIPVVAFGPFIEFLCLRKGVRRV